jgi:hypothetical protein
MQMDFNVIDNAPGNNRFLLVSEAGAINGGYLYRSSTLYPAQSSGANNWSSTVSWLDTGIIQGNNNFAFGYSPGSNSTARDGVIEETNTDTVIVEQTSAELNIMDQLNGHISRLAYYPYRLPDTTLQEITS